MSLQSKVSLKINQSIEQVFDSVVNPQKMCGYFISTASAPMTEGSEITWTWADMNAQLVIKVQKIKRNESITFQWSATGVETTVEITLKSLSQDVTQINVIETGWPCDQTGAEKVNQQTGGWMNMLFCMKGFLEYNISLRDGSVCGG